MINHLESGIRNPTVIVVHALASALDVDLAKLIRNIPRQQSGRRQLGDRGPQPKRTGRL
jgi:transcriptional regulator with XRE-family HTH domain